MRIICLNGWSTILVQECGLFDDGGFIRISDGSS